MENKRNLNKKSDGIMVSFSSGFLEKIDKAVKKKDWRNRQDLIRRATEDLVEKILNE